MRPLGPDSLTWRYFGDVRMELLATWVTVVQNMLPDLGAGVLQHSAVLTEPLQRASRSLYPIIGVVYDQERAAQTAQRIVGYHKHVGGVTNGHRYHALDDDTFYWAHATFFMQMLRSAELFHGKLSNDDKLQLYDEHIRWYSQYGKSMKPVPGTWEEFTQYWQATCETLEPHQAALDILYLQHTPRPAYVPARVPDAVWNAVAAHAAESLRWVATGGFDPIIRKKLGLEWTLVDELALRLFGLQVRLALSVMPARLKLHPRAAAAYTHRTPPEPPKQLAAPPGPGHHPSSDEGLPRQDVPQRVISVTILALAGAASAAARIARAGLSVGNK